LDIPDITRLAIWRSRAYLISPSIPSSLLEISWQPTLPSSSRVRRFPAIPSLRRCHGIQTASDVKTDTFGRLWVLDSGSETCPPKILIYDMLVYRFNENIKYEFEYGVILDNFVVDSGSTRHSSMAYLTGDNQLFVYSIYKGNSWRVKTNINNEITGLTINKGGLYQRSSIFIEVNHLEIFQIYTSNLLDDEVHAEKIGYLLGPNSAGIISDNKGGIYYMLSRDYVALKWNSNLPLEAESHSLILQSYSLLYNVIYFSYDSHKNIWALVNNGTDMSSWCVKLNDLQN
jgi:hypothetical protein